MVNQNVDNIAVTNDKTKTLLVLLMYCISGSLLTLVNKLAIIVFPFTNMLLVLQNAVTVILLLLTYRFFPSALESLPTINVHVLKVWLPAVFLFVTMLTSSLFALMHISVPTLIVIRNLSTLVVAVLEYFVLNNRINNLSIATLFGILLGAIFYAMHDLTFSIRGYIWLCVNVSATSLYQVYIKKVVCLPMMKDIGAIGLSYYNNLISLPILIFLACIMGEYKVLVSYMGAIFFPKIKSIGIVLFSCILGFLLSTTAFALNKLISATSIMVANNVNKFLLIVLSEVLVESTLNVTASMGAISVLIFGWLYSQGETRFSKPVFFFTVMILVVLYAVIELKYVVISMIDTYIFPGSNHIIVANRSRNIRALANNNNNKVMSLPQRHIGRGTMKIG